jgi:hypothetical protein
VRVLAGFRRILTLCSFVIFGLILSLVSIIHIQQWIVRRHAERLFTDIRSVQPQKTTFQEAALVFQRWSAWDRTSGTCREENCVFLYQLKDFSFNHSNLFFDRLWLSNLYMLLGGRPARIYAQVTVRDGLVWGKEFGVALESPAMLNGRHVEYTVLASGGTVSRLNSDRTSTHYDFIVPTACLNCVDITVEFAPEAAATDVSRLLSFDLSCLTALQACHSPAELMPNAWTEYLDGANEYCMRDVVSEIRRAEDIGIFEVSTNTTVACGRGMPCDMAKARLIERLRGSARFQMGATYNVVLSAPVQGHKITRGTRLLILFTDLYPEPDSFISPSSCGTMFLDDHNLSVVRHNLDKQP